MNRCYRCGKKLEETDVNNVEIDIRGEKKTSVTVCKDCAELLLDELTPAFIPDYSISRLDIKRQQLGLQILMNEGKNLVDMIDDKINKMKERGRTVPEIANKLKMTNRSVMDFINRG